MSRWWRNRIELQLGSAQAVVTLHARGLRRRDPVRKILRPDAADARGLITEMDASFASNGWRNADMNVTLCGGLVRYLLLPAVAKLGSRDALVYARHAFTDRYGEIADQWTVCVESGAGRSRVAAATEQPLLDALRALAERHALNLRSVRPQFCSAVDALEARERRYSGWLALIDNDHSCVARFAGGECTALRAARIVQSVEHHLVTQLEHDALCGPAQLADRKLYLYAAAKLDRALLNANGWRASLLTAEAGA